MQVTKRNNLKVCNAARSSSNSTAFFAQACLVGSIKQRAQNQSKERISRVMGSYIRKTDRIEQSKRKRESQMLALQERHKKALIDHKQRQGEMLEQQKKEDVKALQDYARQLEDRDKKTRQLIEVSVADLNFSSLESNVGRETLLARDAASEGADAAGEPRNPPAPRRAPQAPRLGHPSQSSREERAQTERLPDPAMFRPHSVHLQSQGEGKHVPVYQPANEDGHE